MTAQINLTIIAGKLTGQIFNFSDRIQKQIFIDCGGIPGQEPSYNIYC